MKTQLTMVYQSEIEQQIRENGRLKPKSDY